MQLAVTVADPAQSLPDLLVDLDDGATVRRCDGAGAELLRLLRAASGGDCSLAGRAVGSITCARNHNAGPLAGVISGGGVAAART